MTPDDSLLHALAPFVAGPAVALADPLRVWKKPRAALLYSGVSSMGVMLRSLPIPGVDPKNETAG